MQGNSFQIIDALEDLLDKERAAILNGALEDMGRIAGEKDKLLQGAELQAPDPNTLERVRKKASRNQQLLTAAIQGVRSVTARLDALRKGHSDLNTYDRTGQRTTLGVGRKGALQRRA